MATMRKAIIRNLDIKGSDSEKNIVCQFNPTDLTLSKSGSWQGGSDSQKNTNEQKFAGNNPVSLKVKLFFDTYAGFDDNGQPTGNSRSDVRHYTQKLWDLLVPEYEKHKKTNNQRPSRVQFMWGGFILPYEFFVESLSEQLTLFTMDGIPVRSTIDLSLKEINGKDYQGDGVSSNSAGSVSIASFTASKAKEPPPLPVASTHVVQNNDTLTKIAHERLGSADRWRELVLANIENATNKATSARNKLGSNLRDLQSGIMLKIPE
jgi:Contractile injection system tube protein